MSSGKTYSIQIVVHIYREQYIYCCIYSCIQYIVVVVVLYSTILQDIVYIQIVVHILYRQYSYIVHIVHNVLQSFIYQVHKVQSICVFTKPPVLRLYLQTLHHTNHIQSLVLILYFLRTLTIQIQYFQQINFSTRNISVFHRYIIINQRIHLSNVQT